MIKNRQVEAIILALVMAPVAALTLSGCAPVGTDDAHADEGTRMMAVAQRFDQDRQEGGMRKVISDTQQCYETAISPSS